MMLRIYTILICFCQSLLSFAQLTINITSIPASTPKNASIFIAGNFNSWNPGDPGYQLTETGNDQYSITFTPAIQDLEFKFTRGSWASVEGNAEGHFLPNRTYQYNGQASMLDLTIAGWEDVSGGTHTAADNVQILYEDFFMPQLNRSRRIWLYLPPDYDQSSKQYPVIYMHDGQNLFDAATSFAGEWKVDESMNELFAAGDYGAIVVGIDNGGAERSNEYSPYVNSTFGGGDGEAYVSFIVNTLKPHIDSTFRTLPGRDYTVIAGSSMGGVISMWAANEYPDVFGKAGIFSPAFWFSDSLFQHAMQQTFDEDIRVYFVASENESQSMIPLMEDMHQTLVDQGVDSSNVIVLNETDGAHSEWFWAREYPDAYEWLFENLALNTTLPQQKKTKLFPNPVADEIMIEGMQDGATYSIYALSGEKIITGKIQGRINARLLSPGTYLLEYMENNNLPAAVLFTKQ